MKLDTWIVETPAGSVSFDYNEYGVLMVVGTGLVIQMPDRLVSSWPDQCAELVGKPIRWTCRVVEGVDFGGTNGFSISNFKRSPSLSLRYPPEHGGHLLPIFESLLSNDQLGVTFELFHAPLLDRIEFASNEPRGESKLADLNPVTAEEFFSGHYKSVSGAYFRVELSWFRQ